MKYTLKKIARETVHRFKFMMPLYKKLSGYKTRSEEKYDDETFFKRRYKENTGKELNLENPQTFNEKLLWLQIHDRNPVYTTISDKYLVKNWVAERIGAEYVVPLIGVWDSVDDIPFDELPDEYVLKCNHDCGSVMVKRKGEKFDVKKVKKRFRKALKRNYYPVGRVWGYKNIVPKVFAEEYINSMDGEFPRDYKIFCFYGEPKFAFVASDRGKDTKFDFFDLEWNKLPVKQHYPNSSYDIPKPKKWDEMLDIARKLSQGIPHVRVDLYIKPDDSILFGELTLCHFSGKEEFEPDCFDIEFGKYLDIERVKNEPFFKE